MRQGRRPRSAGNRLVFGANPAYFHNILAWGRVGSGTEELVFGFGVSGFRLIKGITGSIPQVEPGGQRS